MVHIRKLFGDKKQKNKKAARATWMQFVEGETLR